MNYSRWCDLQRKRECNKHCAGSNRENPAVDRYQHDSNGRQRAENEKQEKTQLWDGRAVCHAKRNKERCTKNELADDNG